MVSVSVWDLKVFAKAHEKYQVFFLFFFIKIFQSPNGRRRAAGPPARTRQS
jgi:hypothetical protein